MPAGDVAGPAVVVEVELLVAVAAEQVKASGPYQTGEQFLEDWCDTGEAEKGVQGALDRHLLRVFASLLILFEGFRELAC